MDLHFKSMGSGPSLVILHGLFGSLDNWMTLARRYAEHFSVFLLDARNHGKSPRSEEFSYEAMSQDLLQFLDSQAIPGSHLIGHSMGGKTVMRFTLDHSERAGRVVVADMAPVAYPSHHNEVFDALLPFKTDTLQSRGEADAYFSSKISDAATRMFILKNLDRKTDGGFEWKFNLPVIHKTYPSILSEINSPWPAQNEVLFLRGGKSEYVKDEYAGKIHSLFPNAVIDTLPGAGHWLHAEAPDAFYTRTMQFLLDK